MNQDAAKEPPTQADVPTARRFVPDYARPDQTRLVTLCEMYPMEAKMAAAKLESEGIACFISGENFASVYSMANATLSLAALQVDQADLDRAREILARPAEPGADGDYVEEDWRCPKCHRKSVELVPMTAPWKRVRLIFILAIAAPVLISLFALFLPASGDLPSFSSLHGAVGVVWIVLLAGSALGLLFRTRYKYCTSCGHRWSQSKGQRAAE